jgi:hypothetical protein
VEAAGSNPRKISSAVRHQIAGVQALVRRRPTARAQIGGQTSGCGGSSQSAASPRRARWTAPGTCPSASARRGSRHRPGRRGLRRTRRNRSHARHRHSAARVPAVARRAKRRRVRGASAPQTPTIAPPTSGAMAAAALHGRPQFLEPSMKKSLIAPVSDTVWCQEASVPILCRLTHGARVPKLRFARSFPPPRPTCAGAAHSGLPKKTSRRESSWPSRSEGRTRVGDGGGGNRTRVRGRTARASTSLGCR